MSDTVLFVLLKSRHNIGPSANFAMKKVTADIGNSEDIVFTSKNTEITETKHFYVQSNFWDFMQNICLRILLSCLSS